MYTNVGLKAFRGKRLFFPVFEWRNYRPLIDGKKELPTADLQQVKGGGVLTWGGCTVYCSIYHKPGATTATASAKDTTGHL